MESYSIPSFVSGFCNLMLRSRDSSIFLHERVVASFSFLYCSPSCECMTNYLPIFLLMGIWGYFPLGDYFEQNFYEHSWFLVNKGHISVGHIPRSCNC